MPALRVAFAGTPEFAVPALQALADSEHQITGVLTQPDRPRGRGRHSGASPVKALALALGLSVSQPQELRGEGVLAELAGWRPEVLVVVAYGLLLPRSVLGLPRLGCVNIHASLLPRWRGAAPVQRAILAGDAVTGVTIMQMDAGLDTGPVLIQRSVPIGTHATSGELLGELAGLGAATLLEALGALASGQAQSRAQPAEGVTYAAKISKAEATIDWSADAAHIARQVRAFNPWPIAETRLGGEQLRVHAARALEASGPEAAATAGVGEIFAVRPDAILVRCGRGVLAITELQRPGRRPIGAGDFANAGPLAGKRLG
jgi:methionyl-tRNA formyltransferase